MYSRGCYWNRGTAVLCLARRTAGGACAGLYLCVVLAGMGSTSQPHLIPFSLTHSPPGTETTTTRHRRVPGEPLGPPVEDTHRTVGTTAVSKVGKEPWRLLCGEWPPARLAAGTSPSVSESLRCAQVLGSLCWERAGFLLSLFFPSSPDKSIGIFSSFTLQGGTW